MKNKQHNRTMNMEHLLAATNKVVELNNQLTAVTEQRDRLADALRSLRDCIQETRGKEAYEALRKADEALMIYKV